jgi:hypothetical protein
MLYERSCVYTTKILLSASIMVQSTAVQRKQYHKRLESALSTQHFPVTLELEKLTIRHHKLCTCIAVYCT